jgi:hypothetical protein
MSWDKAVQFAKLKRPHHSFISLYILVQMSIACSDAKDLEIAAF